MRNPINLGFIVLINYAMMCYAMLLLSASAKVWWPLVDGENVICVLCICVSVRFDGLVEIGRKSKVFFTSVRSSQEKKLGNYPSPHSIRSCSNKEDE